MQTSPTPENTRVTHVAANYIEIAWNDFSNGRYLYEIERRREDNVFGNAVIVTGTSMYLSDLQENTEYQIRIRTRVPLPSFEPSDWVTLDPVTTFNENAFTLSAQSNVNATDTFYNQKLVRNANVVDFNADNLSAALIRDGYQFDREATNILDIDSEIIRADTAQYVYGKVPFVILNKSDVVAGSFEDILYVFRRGTREGFFSTNKGVSWTRYFPLSVSTVGNCNDFMSFKSTNTRAALVSDQSIVLGATATSDIRWSNTDIRWSNVEVRFSEVEDEFNVEGGGGEIIRFAGEILFPTGINEIQCFEIYENMLYVIAGGGAIYTVDFSNPSLDVDNNIVFDSVYHQIVDDVDNLYVKSSWALNQKLYILVSGEYNESGDIVNSQYAGVWEYDPETNTKSKVIGDIDSVDPETSSLSTDGEKLVVSLNYKFTEDVDLSNTKPYRKVFYSIDGQTWTYRPERFALESYYGYFRNDNMRVMIEARANITVIVPEQSFIVDLSRTEEIFTQTGEYKFFVRDRLLYNNFPGFAKGIAFYRKDNGYLIGYYEFEYRVRNQAEGTLVDGLLFNAQLESISRNIVINTSIGLPVRELKQSNTLSHILDKIAPEHYVDGDNAMFGKFIEYYLDSISQKDMPYGQLKSLLTNKNVNTTTFLDLFETDLAKRNVTEQGQNRADLITFLKNRSNDFTSAKGVEDSYKWMFRALYDINVDVFIESQRAYETFLVIESDTPNLDELLAGVTVEGPNGRAAVNYVERVYIDGDIKWQLVVQDPRGRFQEGDQIQNVQLDDFDPVIFTGTVIRSLEIRDANPDPSSIQTRARSFYVIRVSSGLSMNRWKNDVLRFVHPVGFNFIGILLITMMLNTGITLRHISTRSEFLQTYRWDSGIPLVVWDETAVLDEDGNYQYANVDGTGFPIVEENPDAGTPINPDASYFTDNPEVFNGLTTQERRKNSSPMFDSTVHRFVRTRKILG